MILIFVLTAFIVAGLMSSDISFSVEDWGWLLSIVDNGLLMLFFAFALGCYIGIIVMRGMRTGKISGPQLKVRPTTRRLIEHKQKQQFYGHSHVIVNQPGDNLLNVG